MAYRDWALFETTNEKWRWDEHFRHRDCSKVELHVSCVNPHKKEGCFHFYASLFVDDEQFLAGLSDGNGRSEKNFRPYVHETMETLKEEGLLEKIMAFAENTKISTRWAMTSGANYECGLCDSRIISDSANKAYDHFVEAHYSGHMVKSAGFQ